MPSGRRFGKFLLREMLATGGMGELYLATRDDDPPETPPVVLKILLRTYEANREFVDMFEDEARIGMRLAHRNIVLIQDYGTVDEVPYIAMEYVHGDTLRAVLRATRRNGESIPAELAVRIAIDVLLGLDHAHRAKGEDGRPLNLVHRDLSPDNVMLSFEGEVKILDFGIAKAEGRSTHTQMGVLKGKAQYMSPEQAFLKPVDARSDLFALGLLLLETLTGEKRLKSEEALPQVLEARDWSPSKIGRAMDKIPPELQPILVRALQPDPDRRHQSADELAAALTRVVRGGTLPRARENVETLMRRLFPDRGDGWVMPDDETALSKPKKRPTADPSPPPSRVSDPDEDTALAHKLPNLAATVIRSAPRPGGASLGPLDDRPTGTRVSAVPDATVTSAPAMRAVPEVPSETQRAARPIASPGFPDFEIPPEIPTGDVPAAKPAATPTGTRVSVSVPDFHGISDDPTDERKPARADARPSRRGDDPTMEGPALRQSDVPTGERRNARPGIPGPTVRAPPDVPTADAPALTPPPRIAPRATAPRAPRRGGGGGVFRKLALLGALACACALAVWAFRGLLPPPARGWVESVPSLPGVRDAIALVRPTPAATPAPVLVVGSAVTVATATKPPAVSPTPLVAIASPSPSPTGRKGPAPVDRVVDEDVTTGRVTVVSDPPSLELLLDGAPTGRHTPVTLDVAPGAHTFGIDAEGFAPWSVSTPVRAGDRLSLRARLDPR